MVLGTNAKWLLMASDGQFCAKGVKTAAKSPKVQVAHATHGQTGAEGSWLEIGEVDLSLSHVWSNDLFWLLATILDGLLGVLILKNFLYKECEELVAHEALNEEF
ncbi:hypothetical protein PRBEI_2001724900 [Prionailurus iriomotensis]